MPLNGAYPFKAGRLFEIFKNNPNHNFSVLLSNRDERRTPFRLSECVQRHIDG